MANFNKRYTDYSIYKMLIDALEEDGAICNYNSKYYDENETYKGGTSSRLAFTKYNDKIKRYHTILKVLNGEQRANIYEQVPAIDMFNLSNSSLMYTYTKTGNKNVPLDPSTLVRIEDSGNRTSLDLIEEEDPSTINRALMGDPVAEHFYNTSGLTSSEYNIQVSPWNGEYSNTYKGVWIDPVIINGEYISGTLKSSLLIYSVEGPVQVPFNPLYDFSDDFEFDNKTIRSGNYCVDSINNKVIILNTDCGWNPVGVNVDYPIYFEGNLLVQKGSSDDTFYLNLSSGDYVVAIPKTTYSKDYNKILIFKASSSTSTNYEEEEVEANPGWLNPNDGKFYENKTFNKAIVPSISTIYLDERAKEESGVYNYYKYSRDKQTYFLLEDVSNSDSSGINIKVKVQISHYQGYVLYISDFSSGMGSAAAFEEVTPGRDLNKLIYSYSDDILEILSSYISISKDYYTNASGLLDGYYCEPLEWIEGSSVSERTVTKWKLSDDYLRAQLKGVSIDIGSRYYPGHLLNRGDILRSPLQLTKSDFLKKEGNTYYSEVSGLTPAGGLTLEDIGINGKASLIYETMNSSDLLSDLMKSSKVNNWESFDLTKLDSVITKFDYSNSPFTVEAIKNITGSNKTVKKPMKYPKKFLNNNSLIGFEDIMKYIDSFQNCIQGDTLVLDKTNPYVRISNSVSTNGRGGSNKETSPSTTSRDTEKDSNSELLRTSPNVAFTVSYNVHYKSDGRTYSNSFENPTVNVVTPRELFFKNSGETPDTILVFPEYNNYFPETALLLSRRDLKLEKYSSDDNIHTRGVCTFLTKGEGGEDKALMFKVSSVMPLKFSSIRKIRISDNYGSNRITSINKFFSGPGEYLCGRQEFDGAGKGDRKDYDKKEELIRSLALLAVEDESLIDEYVNSQSKGGIIRSAALIPFSGTLSALAAAASIGSWESIRRRAKEFRRNNLKNITMKDCYIYTLDPISINIGDKIKIYDANDDLIKISDYEDRSKMVAMSYPDESYFPVNIVEATDGSIYYKIPNEYINNSFETLKESVIIPGLPNYSKVEDLKYYVKSLGNNTGYSLKAIGEILGGKNIQAFIRRVLNSILGGWKLSNSSSNPLVIDNVPLLLDGMIEFGNVLEDLSQSDFSIIKGNGEDPIRSSDLEGLLKRIREDDSDVLKKYSFTYKGGDSVTSNLNDLPKVLRSRICYSKSSDTEKGIKVDISNYDKSVPRKSLTSMKGIMNNIYEGSGDFDLGDCKRLDEMFGNNTKPFIDIGDLIEDEERVNFRSSGLSKSIDEYYNLILDIMTSTINEFLYENQKSTRLKVLESLKYNYCNLYTAGSVESAITDNGTLNIDTSKLVWDYYAPVTNKILNDLKMNRVDSKTIGGVVTPYSYILYWKRIPFSSFLDSFLINPKSDYEIKGKGILLKKLSYLASSYTSKYLSEYQSELSSLGASVSREDVENYLEGSSDNSVTSDNIRVVPSSNNRFTFITALPMIETDSKGKAVLTEEGKVKLTPSDWEKTTDPSEGSEGGKYVPGGRTLTSYIINNEHPDKMKHIWAWSRAERINDVPDVSLDTLTGISDYAKVSLEGSLNEEGGKDVPYVKYVSGENSEPEGRVDSLYYKRYQMLNNRMNRLQGPLWKAASYLRNNKVFEDMETFSTQLVDSYDKFVNVVPVESMDSLTYMPPQEATLSTIELPGKFYSDAELNSMKASINSKCVLTCNSCSVKDTCPFYDENEVIKMYCTGVETIDLWIKDNELDLLGDIKIESPEGEGFSKEKYSSLHKPYSDVVKKISSDGEVIDTYEVNDLNRVREDLKAAELLEYSKYVKDDLGWLNHGRYGTVERNSIRELLDDSPDNDYYSIRDKIHPYRYLYDALFINDEESYVNYSLSNVEYPVTFDMGKPGDKKRFSGTTRVKIPTSLKVLEEADNDDDVYLVSDDTRDSNNEEIVPVIYLGKVGNVQITFDLIEDGLVESPQSLNRGSLDPKDPKIYASDVAQWCINYYKGSCFEDPIGSKSDNVLDNFSNRDQYWMEKVYKKIYLEDGSYKWYEFPGRKRSGSGYSEPLIGEDTFDDVLAVSGRPMIANYVNFLRKVSIRIYNNEETDENLKWTIPWVNPYLPLLKGGSTLDPEKQRSILPLMKTNLRLVVVKSGKS